MESSSQTRGHSSNNNRRQDQQSSSTNSATVSTSNVQRASKSNLVFNTFRSHLSVLRASVAEKDEDHHAPAMMASNYNHYHANANRLREDDMSYAEKLFVSPEDELVGENEWQKRMYGIAEAVSEDSDEQPPQLPQQPIFQHPRHKQPHHVKAEFNFEDATKCTSADQDDLLSIRTDECTQVTKLKRRRRGRKARDASMVGAFVTFLKALFGIGMLSNPAVLGEVGLILGTFCHLFIVVGCAFACYLLLMSRQIAKQEVALKQQQHEFERRRWESMTPLRTRMAMLLGKSPRSQSFNKRKSGPTEVEMTTPSTPTRLSKTPKRTNASARESKSCVTDDYHLMTSSPSMPPSPPPPPPPEKPQGARLMTYGDVVKYLAGERASVFMVFTIVAVHLMFASGMVHLAVENLCYVIGMNRLGWSVVEQEYIYDDDLANKFNYYQYTFNSNDDYNNNYNNNNDDGGGYNDDVGYNDDYYARFLKSESSSGSEDAGQSEELLYLQWQGADFTERLSMASMLFPVILLLLQIPSLRELTTISSFGLLTYAFGCIGTMMYVSFVTTSGHPFQDHPEDIWTAKWRGIPTYVATTVYAIEGINLALPTVVSVEGIQRVWKLKKNASNPWLKDGSPLRVPLGSPVGGNEENGSNGSIRPDLSVYIVCGAVFFYGFITLIVSWVGLAGGLGGGIGTFHEELGCRDVTYCLNSSGARRIYMLSLAVALILTLPVILYPSTEMLEILLDEREEKRRKRMEAALAALDNPVDQPQDGDKSMRNRLKTSRQKSILQVTSRDDDDSQANGREFELGNVQPMGSNEHSPFPPHKQVSESSSITTEPTHEKEQTNESISPIIGDESIISSPTDKSNSRSSPRLRRVKYWKLRMFLAGTIIVIGTIEGSFPQVLKVAEVIRGVGLSIAGLIFPPLLYMSAVGGRFGFPMAAAMSLLVGLGLFNIVLVLMSAFGGKDYIMEESNFYELDWSED